MMSMRTSIESWIEWKRQCALGKCNESVQGELVDFSEPIVLNAFQKYDFQLTIPGETKAARWHLFESYMHTSSGATGKRWKDWLFEKAAASSDDPVQALEGMAGRCMWSAVRTFCCAEGRTKDWQAGRSLVSKDAPGVHDGATLEETLRGPAWLDPSSQVASMELQQIADEEAARYFHTMEWRARVVLLANDLGLSLAHPEVEAAAGRKSSTLYALLNIPGGGPDCSRLLEELRQQLGREYESEDSQTFAELCCRALQSLRDYCYGWGKLEKKCEPLFLLAEELSSR